MNKNELWKMYFPAKDDVIDVAQLTPSPQSVIDVLRTYESICWYPSAGTDLRLLLYLSEMYNNVNGLTYHEKMKLPDVFLLTDISKFFAFMPKSKKRIEPSLTTLNLDTVIVSDGRTEIRVKRITRLQDTNTILVDKNLRKFQTNQFNEAYKLRVSVKSKYKGKRYTPWEVDIIYVSTENYDFCERYLIRNKISVPYIVHIRYPHSGGQFLPFYFRSLNTKMFIGNAFYDILYNFNEMCEDQIIEPYDEKFYGFNSFRNDLSHLKFFGMPRLKIIYDFDGKAWSAYGRVMWCEVLE